MGEYELRAVTVDAAFNGHGVVVGYPPGVKPVGWLDAVAVQNSSSVEVEITFDTSGLATGEHSTVLRFATGRIDGSSVAYRDLPIKLQVKAAPRFVSHSVILEFSSKAGLPTASQQVAINAAADWRLEIFYSTENRDWLKLSQTSGNAQSEIVTVDITAGGLPAGEHSATITLTDAAGEHPRMLFIEYAVDGAPRLLGPSDKRLELSAGAAELEWGLVLTSDHGSAGDSVTWTASSSQPWLTIVNANGDLNGDHDLGVKLDPRALLALADGEHSARISVSFANGVMPPLVAMLNLDLDLDAVVATAVPVELPVTGASSPADLSADVALVHNVGTAFEPLLQGLIWQARSTAGWLTAAAPAGASGMPRTLRLELDAAALAELENGMHAARVELIPGTQRFSPAVLPVNLRLALPSVAAVGPYVAFSGAPGPLALYGSGFAATDDNLVAIGNSTGIARFVTAEQLRMEFPAGVAAGDYVVKVQNRLGIERPGARLLVKDIPAYTAAAVPIAKPFSTFKLDAERQAVLLTGVDVDELYRLHLTAAGHWQGDAFPMAKLSSVELTRDGAELLVAAASSVDADTILKLDADTLAVIDSIEEPFNGHDFSRKFDVIVPLLDGRTLMIDADGFATGAMYPSWESQDVPRISTLRALLSRDRTRMLLGAFNDRDAYAFDLAHGDFLPQWSLSSSFFRPPAISMGTDGSRIVAYSGVFDGHYQLLGELAAPGAISAAAVTPDGTAVFGRRAVDDVTQIFRYDIRAAAGPYTADPTPLSIALGADERVVDLKVSDDGAALFLLAVKFDPMTWQALSSVFYVHPLQ